MGQDRTTKMRGLDSCPSHASAESLIEFKKIGDSSKSKDKRGKPAKGGEEKEKASKEFPPKPAFEKEKFHDTANGGSDRLKKLACYFCGDSHKAMDCPKSCLLYTSPSPRDS